MGKFDFSETGWGRVALMTVVGTICVALISLLMDMVTLQPLAVKLEDPFDPTAIVISLILAPPFFFFLMQKMRQLAIVHEELKVLATTDSLTECLNRGAFTMMVDTYLEKSCANQTHGTGALLVVDADHFKSINDTHGHQQGDNALKVITQTIQSSLRSSDLLGRLGGEEFGVFLPRLKPEEVALVAERIRASVAGIRLESKTGTICLSVSIGGAMFGHSTSFRHLFKVADEELYKAKLSGRNQVSLSSLPLEAQTPEATTLH